MTTRAQQQANQINAVLATFDQYNDVKTLNDKYQLEVYKAFYKDVKKVMG